MSTIELIKFDPAEYLENKEAFKVYVDEALKTGDVSFITKSMGVVERAKESLEHLGEKVKES